MLEGVVYKDERLPVLVAFGYRSNAMIWINVLATCDIIKGIKRDDNIYRY